VASKSNSIQLLLRRTLVLLLLHQQFISSIHFLLYCGYQDANSQSLPVHLRSMEPRSEYRLLSQTGKLSIQLSVFENIFHGRWECYWSNTTAFYTKSYKLAISI